MASSSYAFQITWFFQKKMQMVELVFWYGWFSNLGNSAQIVAFRKELAFSVIEIVMMDKQPN
jgi:hypothetical protein